SCGRSTNSASRACSSRRVPKRLSRTTPIFRFCSPATRARDRETGHNAGLTDAGFRWRHAMTSIANSASEVMVQHRSLLIERGYEEFTGRLEQILGRFVASELKGLTPDGAIQALKSMEGEQGFMIINIFDHGADLLMVGQRRKAKQYLIGNPLLAIQVNRYDIRAALYAPLRVLVFESAPGRTVVEF